MHQIRGERILLLGNIRRTFKTVINFGTGVNWGGNST